HQLLEQLRPLPVSREADPADDRQCAGWQAAADLRRRPERARLAVRGRPLQRDPRGAGARPPGRDLQRRRLERDGQHRHRQHPVRAARRAAPGCRRQLQSADHLREGPPRPRPPLRHRRAQDRARARLAPGGDLPHRHPQDRAVVPGQPGLDRQRAERRLPRLGGAQLRRTRGTGMKILLLGKNGQVGWELQRALAPLGALVALDRAGADGLRGDLEDLDGLARTVRKLAPDVIVNAAAYTAVDKAETDVPRATCINAEAPAVLAVAAAEVGALLVHYSTDYVFDGSGDKPWREDSPTGPLSVYGRTKLAGEAAIRASGCRHLIFRTSWVHAARGMHPRGKIGRAHV